MGLGPPSKLIDAAVTKQEVAQALPAQSLQHYVHNHARAWRADCIDPQDRDFSGLSRRA